MAEGRGEGEQRSGLTRRGLIGGAAAGAAGYAAGSVPGAAAAGRRKRVDVVVVGAGLAGLSAARRLRAKGRSVAVLEARNRVGGRTLNFDLGGGEVVEIGGQWVGPTQDRVLALIKQLGLKTFPTYNTGNNIYYRSDAVPKLKEYTGAIPPADTPSLVELAVFLNKLNTMAQEVPLDKPWKAAKAEEWDGQTFETFKLANTTLDEARDLIDLSIAAVFAAESRDLSLLHVLFYIRSGGTFDNLINVAGGAQESRVVGGSQKISLRLARDLGRSVVLGAPVVRIDRVRGGVEVQTPKGTWRAKRAIVTVPPTLAGQIHYQPELPALRSQLTQRVPMGSVIKCLAVYKRPFWREINQTGQATSDVGATRVTFDNTPPSGSPGILLGFIEGQQARIWGARSRKARRDAVIADFTRYFGPDAAEPSRYIEKSWAEERWSGGCYVGYMAPGVLLDYGEALRRPVGRIHWAGTETATLWTGYMDGAIQSGYRAAAEVLEAL